MMDMSNFPQTGASHTAAHGDDAEAALLQRYAQGDAAAARLLAATLTPRLYGHALRVLGDRAEAEDVAQEAMLKLWKVAPEWRSGEARVSTWLYRVVANRCIDRLRKRRSTGLDEIDEPADPAVSVERRILDAARLDALQQALDQLPDRQKQAVVLRHIDGLANPEIAVILETGVAAVESLTARGKRALTQALAGQKDALGYDDD
ncbi:RNA polymerase sigma factor [Sulfitobacter sp. M57]|uniref:RNA polymerase sigma factor n=1 Tax=unclassified Sulfitobacter TaxID=196795 RepID=UPI0023E1DD36|nr:MULTISPECIES: RNA polymerase sigma factor [unclassified Sulfitobacter]MDF3413133.1 RNA polymerase sigma factor [Sulfitobacter sp. KE5]MDF3421584.1 RNA polymerase sigma factor [Sulfitobacter sp. KE43]MDF3431682.1 RNA polymerase sigma factor [Sulfitobacter sp. KE42]MDF3457323.1 RNA polymerase sigma factor [Sulfitobacter sp. S74]MDF3461225.1 RNA polymerase sigma factor [Sulfitobacter sp. Ks18]